MAVPAGCHEQRLEAERAAPCAAVRGAREPAPLCLVGLTFVGSETTENDGLTL
jgi:hypothetical protein